MWVRAQVSPWMQSGGRLGLTYFELIRAESSPRYLAFSLLGLYGRMHLLGHRGGFLPFLWSIHSCVWQRGQHTQGETKLPASMSLVSLPEVCGAVSLPLLVCIFLRFFSFLLLLLFAFFNV